MSMQNVLIGHDLNGCAFVCGSLSFLDKLSCGIALYILQSYQSKLTHSRGLLLSYLLMGEFDFVMNAGISPSLENSNSLSYCFSVPRYGFGLVPALCSLLGVAVTYTMNLHTPPLKALREPLLA